MWAEAIILLENRLIFTVLLSSIFKQFSHFDLQTYINRSNTYCIPFYFFFFFLVSLFVLSVVMPSFYGPPFLLHMQFYAPVNFRAQLLLCFALFFQQQHWRILAQQLLRFTLSLTALNSLRWFFIGTPLHPYRCLFVIVVFVCMAVALSFIINPFLNIMSLSIALSIFLLLNKRVDLLDFIFMPNFTVSFRCFIILLHIFLLIHEHFRLLLSALRQRKRRNLWRAFKLLKLQAFNIQ